MTPAPLCLSAANRPKSLLVYINPYGGKRRAKCIYEQKVAPLFLRACITTDVIGGFPISGGVFLFVCFF